jgi:AAA domain
LGAPKCGKSFFTFDLSMHVALGWTYRGQKVEQGTVVYCAAEGGVGFSNRVEAWRQRHLAEDHAPIPFYLLAVPLDLIAEHHTLIAAIRAQAGDAPKLVVLDTLNRTLVGSENKPEDMAKYIKAADAIRTAFGTAVIIIHHCGVDDSRPRGHTSLAGADDAQIAVSRDSNGVIRIEVEHFKDGVPAKPFACRLEGVDIGTCDDGDTLTSCVVVPADPPPGAKKKGNVTSNQNRFLDILADAILDAPPEQTITAGIPGGRTAVSREWLKRSCAARGWFQDDGSSGKSRAKLSDMINALAGKRLIGASNLFVWDARG